MASIRKQRKAQIQEALKKAGAAYKQGNYDEALKFLQPFLSDETVQKAISKILAANQEASEQESIEQKPKRDKAQPSKDARTVKYILASVFVCGGLYLLGLFFLNSDSGSNNSVNPFALYARDYYTSIDDVIVRTCATFACENIVELPVGTRVGFIEALEGEASPVDGTTLWYHVRLSDNREGFINSRVLTDIRPTPAPSPIPPPVSYPSTNSSSSSNQTRWDCTGNNYNCSDLSCSQIASYMSACPNDPSNLDGDSDGRACENKC